MISTKFIVGLIICIVIIIIIIEITSNYKHSGNKHLSRSCSRNSSIASSCAKERARASATVRARARERARARARVRARAKRGVYLELRDEDINENMAPIQGLDNSMNDVLLQTHDDSLFNEPKNLHKVVKLEEEIKLNQGKIIKYKKTKPEMVKKLYKLFFILDHVLNENKVEYWIDGGTLLGAIRHGGLIPWDDDGDIEIWENDEKKVSNLAKIFEQFGITLMPVWFGFKIFFEDSQPISGFEWKYPFIDIFVVKEDNNKNIVFKYESAQKIFGNCNFSKNSIYPLQRYKFGSFKLSGVNKNNVDNYLNKCYGKDWRDFAYEQYDHENEKSRKRIKFKLTQEDKKAAQPILNMYLNKI